MGTARISIGILLITLSLHSSSLFAQDSRTWTATTGHELKGTLVSYDKTNVKIRNEAGDIKSIPKSKLSPIDQNYIIDFPNLDNNATFAEGKLPKVDVRAVRSDSSRTKKLGTEITLYNRDKEALEIEVLWVFYTTPPRDGKIVASNPTDLLPLEPQLTRVTVEGFKQRKFLTHDVRASKLSKGKAWESSMKITGFIVQAYAKGRLLDSHASNGVLAHFAKDPGLLKHFKG